MNRREALANSALLGSALAMAVPAGAQPEGPPVIGFLGGTGPAPQIVRPFLEGLALAGFVDGRNVTLRYRWAHDQPDRLPALLAELLQARVSVIVTVGGLVPALAAKAATTLVPIVFQVGRDPVAARLVASLNRPGGNVTGIYMLTSALNAKRLELLRAMVPRARTVAALFNPANAGARDIQEELRIAAGAVGVRLVFVSAASARAIEAAFGTLVEKRIDALVVTNDAFFNSRREQLVALSTRHGIASIFEWRDFTAMGGLMSYGTDLAEAHRQLGAYAGQILKGTKPAELPVIQPTRVLLVINGATARTLGLTIPQSLMLRADEVIQ